MKEPEFVLRNADNRDVEAIKNVVFTVLREYGLMPDERGKDSDLIDIESSYFKPGGMFGVVTESSTGEVIGTYGVFPVSKEICELRKMYLFKHARGKGLGKKMLEASITFARVRKFRRIVLETIAPLKEAIQLYRKYGFKEIRPAEFTERVDMAFELELWYENSGLD